MENFKYVQSMALVMAPKTKIVDGSHLATNIICRLSTLYFSDLYSTILPPIAKTIYLKNLQKGGDTYPLLVPFGRLYFLLNISINDSAIDVKINSAYNDGSIDIDYLGLFAYVATEIIRRGYYQRDPLLSTFSHHYEKIRKVIPEKYTIYVNDHFASVEFNVLKDFMHSISDHHLFFPQTSSSKCSWCPLQSICISRGPGFPKHINGLKLPLLEKRISQLFNDLVYHSLKKANVDPLLFTALFFFRYFFVRAGEEFRATIKYTNSQHNSAIILAEENSYELSQILSLKDGKLYTDPCTLRRKFSDIRIIGDDTREIQLMMYKNISLEYLLGHIVCEKLDRYLSKKYSDIEKYLFYLLFLQYRFSRNTDSIRRERVLPIYENSSIFFLRKIYNSKLYRDELINIEENKISPTNKAIEIMSKFCGGEAF